MAEITVNVNGSGEKSKNRLSAIQTMRLGQWLEAEKESIIKHKYDTKKVAELASDKLQFIITFSNVNRMCQELNIPIEGVSQPATETLTGKVAFLSECVIEQSRVITGLQNSISELMKICVNLSMQEVRQKKQTVNS